MMAVSASTRIPTPAPPSPAAIEANKCYRTAQKQAAVKRLIESTKPDLDWGEVYGPFIPIIGGMATFIGLPALLEWLHRINTSPRP
jgi:hypothetical protein